MSIANISAPKPFPALLFPMQLRSLFRCGMVLLLLSDGVTGKVAPDCSLSPCPFDDRLKLFIVGDTGGMPIIDATVLQKKVAAAIVQRSPGVAAVMNLGDNFYFTGVENVEDSSFKSRFEDVYDKDGLPWYFIAGNHDHFGNISAQLLYSKYSEKWYFPSLYYKLEWRSSALSVQFLLLDTIELCGNTVDISDSNMFSYFYKKFIKSISSIFNGKKKMAPSDERKAEEQWVWIENQLANSTADYLFVAGHYPVHSVSSHGGTECLQKRLQPLLQKHHATAYFAGHDHTLQHIRINGSDYFVSGAGSRSDASKAHASDVPKESLKFSYPSSKWYPAFLDQLGHWSDGGFGEIDVAPESGTLTFYDKKGLMLYQTELEQRIPRLNEANDAEVLPIKSLLEIFSPTDILPLNSL